jgi:hypothetical protein
MRRRALPRQQVGLEKPVELRIQFPLVKARDRRKQRIGKFAADRRADLRHRLSGVAEAVETRHQ